MIFTNGIDLNLSIIDFLKKSSSVYIYSAYIKIDALKNLIDDLDNIKSVFVRWQPKDFVSGSSDLEIYPYLKSKNVALYRNQRLHAKAYIDNQTKCFITSANISSRALNMPPSLNYNYEIGTVVDVLDLEARYYFETIKNESLLITDGLYDQFVKQKKYFSYANIEDAKFELQIDSVGKEFLISSLPLTPSIGILCDIYFGIHSPSDEEMNCLLHDLVLYGIPFGLEKEDLLFRLKSAFFNHNFIKAFLENLISNNEIYFGKAKKWIHDNCANVPLPRRWEITENIQVLYKWFVELGDGRFVVDVPGQRSERLRIKLGS